MKLCSFETSDGEKTTLEDYVIKMPAGQDKIYYLTGSSLDNLRNSPKLEAFKKRGVSVLLLSDPVDEIWVNNARKFDKYDFVSASAENVDLPKGSEKDGEHSEEVEKSGLVKKLKDALGSLVEDVKVSDRPRRPPPSASCRRARRYRLRCATSSRRWDRDVPEEKRVMEINPDHALIKKIAEESRKAGLQRERLVERPHGSSLDSRRPARPPTAKSSQPCSAEC